MHYKVDPDLGGSQIRISRIRFSLEALVFLYTRQDGHDARLASLSDAKAKEAPRSLKKMEEFHEISKRYNLW